jgi:hypothetical protein
VVQPDITKIKRPINKGNKNIKKDYFLVRLWEREGQPNPIYRRAYQKIVLKSVDTDE